MSGVENWIEDQSEALLQRGLAIEKATTINGLRELQVQSVTPGANGIGGSAVLVLNFFNTYLVSDVRSEPDKYFYIEGGSRVQHFSLTPATGADLPPHVADTAAYVKVTPLGDYSEYTLKSRQQNGPASWDPLFEKIPFRFRPECYSTDCRLTSGSPPAEKQKAPIDYLARDYDGFRHMLFSYMSSRVPGWQPTSEADLDQVLISLISAVGDQLADFQDRVMSESSFFTARKRVSLARHARLVDYHIHQGKQSSAWVYVNIESADFNFYVRPGFKVSLKSDSGAEVAWSVAPDESYYVHSKLNDLTLYTWSGTRTVLKRGATQMDLTKVGGELSEDDAKDLVEYLKEAKMLWIEETRNPYDGSEAGKNLSKRQVLHLDPGKITWEVDPVKNECYIQVSWLPSDALRDNYYFSVRYQDETQQAGAALHGNLVRVTQGEFTTERFSKTGQGKDESRWKETTRWGTLCPLKEGPVLYRELSEGGRKYPFSTVRVRVLDSDGNPVGTWTERESFVLSDDSDQNGRHFVVETDENRKTVVRFGNGIHGQKIPEDMVVEIQYQKGRGEEGNIGADRIQFKGKDPTKSVSITARNPWEISDGIGPEPVAQILRRVPELYRLRQHRVVTISDIVAKLQEHPDVDKARAFYVWSGSWRSVRALVDPKPPEIWSEELEEKLRGFLEPLMMIGDDLELRPPRYIPLLITVTLCIKPPYSQAVTRTLLNEEFSAGYTPRGEKGFFHPSLWTFGQSLEESPLIGRVHKVEGVDHVESISTIRWGDKVEPILGRVTVGDDDIIQVLSNPDGAEKGYINFVVKGGRP